MNKASLQHAYITNKFLQEFLQINAPHPPLTTLETSL